MALPIEVVEHILSYLDGVDKQHAIKVFVRDESELSCKVWRRLYLAEDYRFTKDMVPGTFRRKQHLIAELDLTGIYWIPPQLLRTNILKLRNLERLKLLGTCVIIREKSDYECYLNLPKIQFISIMKSSSRFNRNYHRRIICGQHIEAQNDLFRISTFECKQHFFNDWNQADWLRTYMNFNKNVDDSGLQLYYGQQIGNVAITKLCESASYIKITESHVESGIKYETCNHNEVIAQVLSVNPLLTMLHVDIASNIDMKIVFQNCPLLKKLSIVVSNMHFILQHLEFAHNLEDLRYSVQSKQLFNLDRFFYELRHAHLKITRLFIDVNVCQTANFKSFAHFLAIHKNVLVFGLVCIMTQASIKQIQRMLRQYKTSPQQVFVCHFKHVADDRFELYDAFPMIHWDLLGRCIWSKYDD